MSSKFNPGDSTQKSFRDAPVSKRSIWESWAVLPAKTRLKISLGITGVALAGMFISDQLEKSLPTPHTSQPALGDAKSS